LDVRGGNVEAMRVRVVVILVLVAGSLAWVGTNALSGNLVYYVTPTELLHQHPDPGERLRLGGQVVPGSVRDIDGRVDFVVTDGTTRMTVDHTGGTPALFRNGIGVVLEGTYGTDGAFHSDNMLIKHSEEYSPPADGASPSPFQAG
jgi:cytochrome c-type biogenesis protein CcmE